MNTWTYQAPGHALRCYCLKCCCGRMFMALMEADYRRRRRAALKGWRRLRARRLARRRGRA